MKYLVDPHNVTNFNRTDNELELFWLFCVLVAGKNSKVQAIKLGQFLGIADCLNWSPFELIDIHNRAGYLDYYIRQHKLGQYKRVHRCFLESLDLDLRNCTVEDLEAVYGVGPKTARFFLLHTRRNQNLAVLDTHILRWLRSKLDVDFIPKATPSGKLYHKIEELFLDLCKDHGKTPAEMDLDIWSDLNKGVAT